MINVACVLSNVGDLYGVDYVYKLKRAFERHLHTEHRFYCFAHVKIPDVDTIELRHDWPGLWAKIEMFRPHALSGPTLYCDLDVIITGDVTELAKYKTKPGFFMIDDVPEYPQVHNSSLMWWDSDNPAWWGIYEEFARRPRHFMEKHSWDGAKPENYADQSYIAEYLGFFGKKPIHWQQCFPKEWFKIFSAHGRLTDDAHKWEPNDGSRLWYALGQPKAHQQTSLPLVERNWV